MSSRAEKAAAMRAKILARSKDRMATVTGMPSTPSAATNEDAAASADSAAGSSSSAAAAPSSSLSAEDAAAALDAALDEMGSTPNPAPVAAVASSDAPSTSAADASTPVADPHEFPSALEMRAAQTPRGPDADFNAFAQQMMTMQQAPVSSEPSAAVRAQARRRAKDAAAASSLDMPLPPAHSPLVLWQARVSALLRSTPPLRMATMLGVVLAGAMAGLGYLEGGFGWLILVQIIAQSTAFVLEMFSKKQNTSGLSASAAAAARRPAPSPPPMDSPSPAPPMDDDANVIELDTDAYRSAMGQTNAAGAFPGFPAGFPGLGGGASGGLADLKLSAFGLPPVVDTLLSGAMLFFKYAAVMRQVLNDAMIFLFVLVISNALLQLSYAESVVYTQQ